MELNLKERWNQLEFEKLKSLRFKFIHFTAIFVVLILGLILLSLSLIFIRGEPSAIMENLGSKEILYAIQLSLWTSTVSTIFCILLAIPIAFTLARTRFFGKSIVNTILDLPMSLPPIVAGVALLLLFGTTPVGDFFASFGIEFVFTVWGILVAQFFVNLPLAIRILRSTFLGIDPRYEHVAKTLGCSGREAFQKVTLPLAKQGIYASFTLTWARAIGEFGATLMLAGSFRMKTETLPISVYLNMSSGDLQLAIAAAIILIIISVISLFICEKFTGAPKIF